MSWEPLWQKADEEAERLRLENTALRREVKDLSAGVDYYEEVLALRDALRRIAASTDHATQIAKVALRK